MSDYIEVDGLRVGPCMWRNLKEQNEQLKARVAELEDALVWSLGKLSIEVPVSGGNASYIRAFEKSGAVLGRSSSESWLLRKQAEAVEEMASQPKRWEPGELFAYAQHLRQHANKLENKQ